MTQHRPLKDQALRDALKDILATVDSTWMFLQHVADKLDELDATIKERTSTMTEEDTSVTAAEEFSKLRQARLDILAVRRTLLTTVPDGVYVAAAARALDNAATALRNRTNDIIRTLYDELQEEKGN